MKIAYISLHWLRTTSSGVGKKISRQIAAWKKEGHDVQLFMHAARDSGSGAPIQGEIFYYQNDRGIFSEIGRIQAALQLLEAVQQYKPNLIYLRYGMYVFPIHRLASIAPLVEELNTNDIAQHKRLGILYGFYNRLTRGILISHTSGLVCLSNELASLPNNADFEKPTIVIGDGFDLDNISPLPAPQNAQPRVAFIGTPDSPWQGVDKLVQLAHKISDISVHVIGYDHIEKTSLIPSNMHLYGYLDTQEYKALLGTMDCAIGSLGLHRIKLNEASPLKTRECLALGLPMVLPYKDTDLNNLQCDFLLKIPNSEDNIQTHAQAVCDFAHRMRGQRVDRSLIASIDQTAKEQDRLRFFETVISCASDKPIKQLLIG
jgi:hypothetical protein